MPTVSGAGVSQGLSLVFGGGSTGGTSPSPSPGGGNGQASSGGITLPSSKQSNPIQTGLIPQFGDPVVMFETAQALIEYSATFITELTSLANSLYPQQIVPNFPTAGAAPTPITVQPPTLVDVTWNVPTQPGAFVGALNIANLLPGPLTITPPTLNFGSAPAPFNAQVPQALPIDLNFTYPNPQVTLPSVPSLMSLDVVAFNPLQIPTFDITVPTLKIGAPNVIPYTEGAGYTSQLLTDLQTSLDTAIADGTYTTVTAAAQQALWDAGREREYRAQADALLELDRMELLGFALPPGVYIDARIKIQTETQNTVAGLSRDIMAEQAKLQLQNIIAAREQATTLERSLIDYANNVNQRALEAVKYSTESAIAIYNAQVQSFQASLEGYKTQALVYDTQLKGIQAYVDQLNAQIAFEKTKADINTALVEQYKAEVDAALASVQIYDLQVKIIQTQAEIEKIKVDVFNAQIQAYVGQVNAYTAEIEGYKALVSTQGVIESVYKTQVDAYAAEVQAGVAEANATVEGFKGQIAAYEAQLEGYKASLEAMVEQARAAALYNTAQTEVYKGEVSAASALNEAVTQQWVAILNEQEQIAQVGVKAAEANGQLYIAAKQLSVDATKVGAQVAAQLGAAALNAIHWSNSSTWGISATTADSTSNVTSTATNTNYNSTV